MDTVTTLVFEYLYRDNANYKSWGHVHLYGVATDSSIAELRNCLEGREYFVAEQVGLPVLYGALWKLSDGPTSQDNAFLEFVDIRAVGPCDDLTIEPWGTFEELLERFTSVRGHWNCALSPHAYL